VGRQPDRPMALIVITTVPRSLRAPPRLRRSGAASSERHVQPSPTLVTFSVEATRCGQSNCRQSGVIGPTAGDPRSAGSHRTGSLLRACGYTSHRRRVR
jgi:hypothetical protein